MRCSVGCKTPPDTAAPDAGSERTRLTVHRRDQLLSESSTSGPGGNASISSGAMGNGSMLTAAHQNERPS